MLEEYHRQTTLKPFAPVLKDRSRRRWYTDSLNQFNISLLSISNSSQSSDDDIDLSPFGQGDDSSSSSRRSSSIASIELDEQDIQRLNIDPYLLHKHLYGLTSTRTNLAESDVDSFAKHLFDGTRSSLYQWRNQDYHPRAIRPPPFSEHIRQLKKSNQPIRPLLSRSPRVSSVRTTRTESLRLERQQSARPKQDETPKIRPHTSLPQYRPTVQSQTRHSAIPIIKSQMIRSRTASDTTYRNSESTKSCTIALGLERPLNLSSLLMKQMQQDIQSNRVPAYSKALNSALLREHPHPPLNHKYKMKRVRRWLQDVVPSEYLEFNEYASHATTAGTGSTEKLEDESGLLADEKQGDLNERTYEEAHRVLPLFQSEIDRKMRRRDLLLTRIELDLYVM